MKHRRNYMTINRAAIDFQQGDVVRVINPKSPELYSVGTLVKITGNRSIVDFSTHNTFGNHRVVHLSSLERCNKPATHDSYYLKAQKKYYLIIPNEPEFFPENSIWAGEYHKDEKPACGEMIYDVYPTRKAALAVAEQWDDMYRGESFFRISRVDDTYKA